MIIVIIAVFRRDRVSNDLEELGSGLMKTRFGFEGRLQRNVEISDYSKVF